MGQWFQTVSGCFLNFSCFSCEVLTSFEVIWFSEVQFSLLMFSLLTYSSQFVYFLKSRYYVKMISNRHISHILCLSFFQREWISKAKIKGNVTNKRFYNPVISRFFSRFPRNFFMSHVSRQRDAHLYFKDQKNAISSTISKTTIEWRDLNSKQGKLKTGNLWWIYPRL